MTKEDWEYEAKREKIFALERARIEEQEYYKHQLPAVITAKIGTKTLKKHDNRNNTKPISTTSKKSI